MSKGILSLSVYATLCTFVVGVRSYVVSLKCEIQSTVSGSDNLVRNKAKYDTLCLDLNKDGSQKCGVWTSVRFAAFEWIIFVIIILALIYKLG